MHSGEVNEESLLLLCNESDDKGKFYSQIKEDLCLMREDPMVPLLECKATPTKTMRELFNQMDSEDSPEATAHLLYAILLAEVESTFHKINVHAAMTPAEVKTLLQPVIAQAKDLQERYLDQKKNEPADNIIDTAMCINPVSVMPIEVRNGSLASCTIAEGDKEPLPLLGTPPALNLAAQKDSCCSDSSSSIALDNDEEDVILKASSTTNTTTCYDATPFVTVRKICSELM